MSLFVLFSCKGGAQDEKTRKTSIKISDTKIDFFDKKYHTLFTMIVDESTPSDHPIRTYINCDSIGFFTIHFIPKTNTLQFFWKKNYIESQNIENINEEVENNKIDKIIKQDSKDYEIFSYYVPYKYLNPNSNCSPESVFLENNAIAKIYYFDKSKKEWKLLGEEKSPFRPDMFDSNFFINKFPSFFSKRIASRKQLAEIEINQLMKENYSTPEIIIDNILFTRDKNDSLQINTEILDYISKTTTRKNSEYLIALEDYGYKYRNSEDWSLDEFSKIKAYIFNTTYPLRKKYWNDKFEEWYNGKPENFLGDGASWRENDYYGLPKLEEYVDDFRSTYWKDSEL